MQAKGSIIFERFATFHGPQYDIQRGHPHQGFSSGSSSPSKYLKNGDIVKGKGMSYIPLSRASKYDPLFNCTPGFSLMNSTLIQKEKKIVYSSAIYDFEGGLDVLQCSNFDSDLNCSIDSSFQVHNTGECCNIQAWRSRAIYLADDQYYPGSCEADIICSSGSHSSITEATSCPDGFVCDEQTNSTTSTSVKSPPGYVSDFGTTPDASLEAPRSKFQNLCKSGMYCLTGTGISSPGTICPNNYFCPTGSANPYQGTLADDALQRRIDSHFIDPIRRVQNVHYFGHETFNLLSDHDSNCLLGEENSLKDRFVRSHIQTNDKEEKITNQAIKYQSNCARDQKWKQIIRTIQRNECNCNAQLLQIIAVFRLRKVCICWNIIASKGCDA